MTPGQLLGLSSRPRGCTWAVSRSRGCSCFLMASRLFLRERTMPPFFAACMVPVHCATSLCRFSVHLSAGSLSPFVGVAVDTRRAPFSLAPLSAGPLHLRPSELMSVSEGSVFFLSSCGSGESPPYPFLFGFIKCDRHLLAPCSLFTHGRLWLPGPWPTLSWRPLGSWARSSSLVRNGGHILLE